MGNLNSVKKIFDRIKIEVLITSDPNDVLAADKIILPGVGHFKKAMENLNDLNLVDSLNDFVIVKKRPILGICLGMQLMANTSEEGDSKGFGWIDGNVVKFNVSNKLKYKIPHIGWNQLVKSKDSKLLIGISDFSEFYFVHSYHFVVKSREDILTESEYESGFASAIQKENIFGVQFHPEKSHDDGEKILRNFIYL
jgi:glutamine amidotransferase